MQVVSGLRVKGRVSSGIGEGAHYVELYSEELERLLSTKPYPGTLNVLLEECFFNLMERIKPAIIYPPREDLGVVYAYFGYLRGVKVLVVKPSITTHSCRTAEIVSSVYLRGVLGLKDGDLIEVEIVPRI